MRKWMHTILGTTEGHFKEFTHFIFMEKLSIKKKFKTERNLFRYTYNENK